MLRFVGVRKICGKLHKKIKPWLTAEQKKLEIGGGYSVDGWHKIIKQDTNSIWCLKKFYMIPSHTFTNLLRYQRLA